MQRKDVSKSKNITIADADNAFAAELFYLAFDNYAEVMASTTDVELKLRCKVKRLLCQYKEMTLDWRELAPRAQKLERELEVFIAKKTSNKERFEKYTKLMREITIRLLNRNLQKDYIYLSAAAVTQKLSDEELKMYADMMEIKPNNISQVLSVLYGLRKDLKSFHVNDEVMADLCERIGEIHREYASETDQYEIKKQQFILAKETFEVSLEIWKVVAKNEVAEMSLTIVNILRELYRCALVDDSDADRSQVVRAMYRILNSKEITEFFAQQNKNNTEQSISDELKIEINWLNQLPDIDSLLMSPPLARSSLRRNGLTAQMQLGSQTVIVPGRPLSITDDVRGKFHI